MNRTVVYIALLLLGLNYCKENIVNPQNPEPKLSITNPSNGATVEDTIKIEAKLDNYSSDANVEFFVNGITSIYLSDSSKPYQVHYVIPEFYIDSTLTIFAKAYIGNKVVSSDTILVYFKKVLPAANLQIEGISENSLKLKWKDLSNWESAYIVERKSEITDFVQISELAANSTEYTDIGLDKNVTYSYRVVTVSDLTSPQYSDTVNTLFAMTDFGELAYSQDPQFQFSDLRISPSKQIIAATGNKRYVKIMDYDLSTDYVINLFDEVPDDILFDDTNILFISYPSNGVASFNLTTRDTINVLRTSFLIYAFDYDMKNSRIAVGGFSNKIELYDFKTLNKIKEYDFPYGRVTELKIDSKQNKLYAGGNDNFTVFDMSSGEILLDLSTPKGAVKKIEYYAQENLYLILKGNGFLILQPDDLTVLKTNTFNQIITDVVICSGTGNLLFAASNPAQYLFPEMIYVRSYSDLSFSRIVIDESKNLLFTIDNGMIKKLNYRTNWIQM